jgi:hypothetical protein
MDWGLAIAAASLELVILSSAIGIVYRITRVEVQLRAEYTREIALIRAETTKEVAGILAASTAATSALSAKLYQVEIWARDEFVRKGSFETVVTRLERTMEMMGTKIETAVDKMATEIKNMGHPAH